VLFLSANLKEAHSKVALQLILMIPGIFGLLSLHGIGKTFNFIGGGIFFVFIPKISVKINCLHGVGISKTKD
jgi:hypothetical protein